MGERLPLTQGECPGPEETGWAHAAVRPYSGQEEPRIQNKEYRVRNVGGPQCADSGGPLIEQPLQDRAT